MKLRKDTYANNPLNVGETIKITDWQHRQRYSYKGEKPVPIPNEYDDWLISYKVVQQKE